VLCVFARVIFYPIFSSSRQDAKTAKKTVLILLLGVLCAFARVIFFPIPYSKIQLNISNIFG
jgi:hypothetical protein